MKAALYTGDKRLQICDVPTPEIGAADVLVKVAACGVCHTDLHYTDHGTPTAKKPPLILGHEISGTIELAGASVKSLKTGDAVLIPAVLTCGSCSQCRNGRENICENMTMLGNHMDGGFAEFVRVPAKDLCKLPAELPLQDACIIADALTTPYHAVINRARVRPGETVVVIGCGGVGVNAVQLAASIGALVVAVDIDDAKLETAKRLGASLAVNSKSPDAAKEIRKLAGGGADVVFEIVGRPVTQDLALSVVRTGGRVLFVGYSPEPATLQSGKIMFRELDVIGSLGCRPVDYPKVIELVRQKKVQLSPLISSRFPLDRVNDAFDALRSGTVLRTIVTPN